MSTANILPNLNGVALVTAVENSWERSSCILDTANSIGIDAKTSLVARSPRLFQVDPVPSGTVVAVEARVSNDAAWIELWRTKDASTSFIATYNVPYTQQRVVVVSGTGVVKAFASSFPADTRG